MPPEQAASRCTASAEQMPATASHRLDDGLGVLAEPPRGVPLVRVAPGHHEHLLPLGGQVLDHAPAGREVENVVLVDRRRDDQQRQLADRLRGRLVLDQLVDRSAQHHRARGRRQVGADREGVRRHHGRHPRRGRQVAGQVPGPGQDAAAAGVDRRLPRLGGQQRAVARREGVHQVAHHEPHPLRVAPVERRRLNEVAGSGARREVGLHDPVQHRVARPRGVGEPAVLRGRRDGGVAARNAGEFRGQARGLPGHQAGTAGERRGEPQRGAAGEEPLQRAERRLGKEQVKRGRGLRCARRGGVRRIGAHDRAAVADSTSAGIVISRLSSLPVGPLGSPSVSHTCRGYL